MMSHPTPVICILPHSHLSPFLPVSTPGPGVITGLALKTVEGGMDGSKATMSVFQARSCTLVTSSHIPTVPAPCGFRGC